MTDREELDAVEAEHGALTNEYFELKERFAGDATPQWVVDRVEAITPRRDELFDLQWELRKKLNLDPRTGKPKVKAAPTETVDEGWFPELLGPICETSKCKHETDEKSIRTLDKAIVHECCDSCSYHLIRYIVDGRAVAGLSLRASKPWRGKQSAVIDSVFTAPNDRRRGYASKIMEYAREYFREVKHSKQLTTMGKAWKKAVKNPPDDDLAICAVKEEGVEFRTGQPVSFHYIRNTERAGHYGSRFGQDIEPAGRYLLHREEDYKLTRGWEQGDITFENPLVLRLTTDEDIYGPNGWKARLSRAFGNKKGKSLSKALLRAGYDGIVTCGDNDTREIVDLTVIK